MCLASVRFTLYAPPSAFHGSYTEGRQKGGLAMEDSFGAVGAVREQRAVSPHPSPLPEGEGEWLGRWLSIGSRRVIAAVQYPNPRRNGPPSPLGRGLG